MGHQRKYGENKPFHNHTKTWSLTKDLVSNIWILFDLFRSGWVVQSFPLPTKKKTKKRERVFYPKIGLKSRHVPQIYTYILHFLQFTRGWCIKFAFFFFWRCPPRWKVILKPNSWDTMECWGTKTLHNSETRRTSITGLFMDFWRTLRDISDKSREFNSGAMDMSNKTSVTMVII